MTLVNDVADLDADKAPLKLRTQSSVVNSQESIIEEETNDLEQTSRNLKQSVEGRRVS